MRVIFRLIVVVELMWGQSLLSLSLLSGLILVEMAKPEAVRAAALPQQLQFSGGVGDAPRSDLGGTRAVGGSHVRSKRIGGVGNDEGYAVAVDPSGNIVVTGTFVASVDFGAGTVFTAGGNDIFVAKYSGADGSHLWSKRFGSTIGDVGRDVAVDGNGDVVVTGYFSGSVDFGGGPLVSPGNDVFLLKLSGTNGSHLWSKRFGSSSGSVTDVGTSVAVDSAGNVVVTGYFQRVVDFGGGELISGGTVPGIADDIFVAKYASADGAHLWSKRFGPHIYGDQGLGVAVDANDNVVITGYCVATPGPIGPGPINFGGGPLTGVDGIEIFVVKLSPGGSHIWSKLFGNTGSDNGYAVAVDTTGNVLVTGTFVGTVDFGGNPLTSVSSSDGFLVKLSPSGSPLWSRRLVNAGSVGVAADSNGNVVVTGSFVNTSDFGGGPLTSGGQGDIFIAAYSGGNGAHLWSKRFGNTAPANAGRDGGRGVVISGDTAIVTGYFAKTVDFGGGPLIAANQSSTDIGTDIFILWMTMTGQTGPPDVFVGGVVNNASFAPSPAPVAPGSIAAVFGTNLNDGSTVLFSNYGQDGRLLTSLGGSSVTINSTPAPMFYSTPGQLGIQIPFELAGQTSATIVATVAGQSSAGRTIFLDAFAPGIFTANQQGTGLAALLHQDGVTPVTPENPARPGEVVVFFATGLGNVTPSLATGAPSTGNTTASPVTATVDGVTAVVHFSGTAPGFVGLNQVNMQIPPGTRTATEIPVVFTIGGKQSNTVTIPVAP